MIELTRRRRLSGLAAGVTGLGSDWAGGAGEADADAFRAGTPWPPEWLDAIVDGYRLRAIADEYRPHPVESRHDQKNVTRKR